MFFIGSYEWEEAYQARQKMNALFISLYNDAQATAVMDPATDFPVHLSPPPWDLAAKSMDMQCIHDSAEAAYAHAPKAKAHLDNELQNFAEKEGLAVQTETEAEACKFSTPCIMTTPIREETHQDRLPYDIVRGCVLCKDLQQVQRCLAHLTSAPRFKLVSLDNRFSIPDVTGK